jgi:uncharacterized protein YwgA
MTLSAAQRYALIAQIVHDYNEVFGRPAGKKALQKLFYVLQRRLSEAKNYAFSFYNYGVYSHDLARDVSEAERYGFLDIDYDDVSNAYSIRPSSDFDENRRFVPSFYKGKILNDVLVRSAKDLELITTIMFVCEEEKISNKEDIIKRVLELKPKFKEREVSECLLPAYCSCAA